MNSITRERLYTKLFGQPAEKCLIKEKRIEIISTKSKDTSTLLHSVSLLFKKNHGDILTYLLSRKITSSINTVILLK